MILFSPIHINLCVQIRKGVIPVLNRGFGCMKWYLLSRVNQGTAPHVVPQLGFNDTDVTVVQLHSLPPSVLPNLLIHQSIIKITQPPFLKDHSYTAIFPQKGRAIFSRNGRYHFVYYSDMAKLCHITACSHAVIFCVKSRMILFSY